MNFSASPAACSASADSWHVLGAGAMGCLWAARLQQDGRSVHFILRSPEAVQQYQGQGGQVIVQDAEGSRHVVIPATCPATLTAPIRNLLLSTKAQHAGAALDSVRDSLSSETMIVLVQNGLQVQQQITRDYGADRVFCLSTSHGAWLQRPFHVVHAGFGQAWLGNLGGGQQPRLQQLLDRLPAQEMAVAADPDIALRLWQKLAINCAINALTLIHDCRNGELLSIPEARLELEALCAEIQWLYAMLPEAPPIADLQSRVREVLQATSENYSSTLQDARRGRDTELGHLNGYLCELAARHNLQLPLNRKLLSRVPGASFSEIP